MSGDPWTWTETFSRTDRPRRPRCSTCRDTGRVDCPEPDGSGLYDQACPDCDAPYPVTGDPDADDPFAASLASLRSDLKTSGWTATSGDPGTVLSGEDRDELIFDYGTDGV